MDGTGSRPGGRWLDQQPPAFARQLLAGAVMRELAPGAPLTFIGDEAKSFIGILEGCAEITWTGYLNEIRLLQLCWPGHWLGEHALITGSPRRGSANARLPTLAAYVPHSHIHRLLEANPAWWRCFAELATSHMASAADGMIELLHRRPEGRCIGMLLRLAGIQPNAEIVSEHVRLPITQEELAGLTNLSRNAVGSLLRGLAEKRILTLRYGEIQIHSLSRLHAELEGFEH